MTFIQHAWKHGFGVAVHMLRQIWRIGETRKVILTTPPDLFLLDARSHLSDNNEFAQARASTIDICQESAVLSNILSVEECRRLIAFLEVTNCFGPGDGALSGSEHRVRRNDLIVWLAPETVTGELWTRIAPLAFPSRQNLGRFAPVGLNSLLRCYRYGSGQAFLPHYDRARPCAVIEPSGKSYTWNHQLESRYSLLIYLNSSEASAFAGGCTTLMPEGLGGTNVELAPPTGGAVVFPHGRHRSSMLHAGQEVSSGTKYVIRLDVLCNV